MRKLLFFLLISSVIFNAQAQIAPFALSGLMKGVYTIQAFDGKSWNSVKVIKQ